MNKNFGGNLQAYALVEVLRRLGHDPLLINRRHPPENFVDDAAVAANDAEAPLVTDSFGMSEAVQNRIFLDKYLTPITRPFFSSAQLARNIDKYQFDAVVVGSDQVWRAKYARAALSDFFLGFLERSNSRTKRISYAGSFGASSWEYDADQTHEASRLIRQFDAVSVREDSAVTLCHDYLSVDAQHVLDPTLLLSADHYSSLCPERSGNIESNRLLTYVLDANADKERVITALSEALFLKAYSTDGKPLLPTGSSKTGRGDKSIEGWLASFRDAAFVVTDSFHGVAFSIIFNKPFIAYGNPSRGLARFTSLLKLAGLEDRLVIKSGGVDLDKMLQPIDWKAVNDRLAALRIKSIGFLEAALAGSSRTGKFSPQSIITKNETQVERPVFTSVNNAWQIVSHGHSTALTVAPGAAIRGNLIWCDLPVTLHKQSAYRLKIDWTVRTNASSVSLCVRNGEASKVVIIGTVKIGNSAITPRVDTVDFIAPGNGFTQFALGAASFTGDNAGADIASISCEEIPLNLVKPQKNISSFADQARELALRDNEQFLTAYAERRNKAGARARLMFSAHSIEKGLSRSAFRAGFGRKAIEKLAVETQNWLAKDHDTDDRFFKAAISVMHAYFERHKKLEVDVSEFWNLFSPSVQEIILQADDVHGGALTAESAREELVPTCSERKFLDVVYGRRSVREFTSAPVRDEDIQRAVQIALQSPSVCNRQAARVHQFRDSDQIKELLSLQGGFNGYNLPPVLLLVTGDQTAFLNPKERNQAFIDGGLFMMTLLLGLYHVGLGSCPLNTSMEIDQEKKIRKILNISKTEVLIAFIAVGHFDPAILVARSTRLPVGDVLVQHEQ
ncbi:polysaccharide pyruvyl transferase family protein [Ancylobacter oerskovii]|nr:polysaccharide pyruvyl transferase family protein [Ancylobacter oerskovii]MBS7544309.1 polysaccharide pyruvyl transferase family protein [Ancylobacter oerskovii]